MEEEKKELPVEGENHKKINKKTIIIFVVAFILILIGVYVLYFQNNKRIIGKAIDNIRNDIEKYYIPNYVNQPNLGEDYTSETDFKMNVESEYLTRYLSLSPEMAPVSKVIENLSKTENKLVIKQDKTNQKAYISLNSKLNQENLLQMKYLIENNTEYYYIEGFLDKYINNGTSNYFESLSSSDTSKDNMKYIYEFAISSFKRNLDDSYFSKKGEKITIDGKEKTLQKVSLELDNNRLIELADKILKDLKSDEKANKILTGIDEDFKKAKVDKTKKLLGTDEKLALSVCLNNISYKIEQYNFEYIENNNHYLLIYEKGDEDNIYLKENDKNIFSAKITHKSDSSTMNLKYDNKNIGTIKINNNQNQYTVKTNLNIEGIKLEMDMNQKMKDIKKNTSYTTDSDLSMLIKAQGQTIAKVELSAQSKLQKGVEIKEDTDDAVFAKDLDATKEDRLQQIWTNIFIKLMSE